MKKVLIPTDFTVESLQLIEYAILNFPEAKLDIILVHGFRLPDTRWGLTHYSAMREVNKLNTDVFAKAKNMFVREHSDVIGRLRFELFTGNNSFAFQNFAEQLDVKDAIIPKGKFLNVNNSKCFDPTRFIKKNIDNVIEIPFELTEEYQKGRFSLSALLNF
ncbi:universal stress protein [Kriegella aquimaris]|uniref:Universal stress protein family protein n=1 Tax=Kriegella aquimaris TaxID=192904 RepID=A0A1G9TL49_9FLAO|nr:universal stress protein [Kriegella aquimaris]SDM48549.1 hypothetical protein SAMN04488514_109118 [Kriegella aquimaris]